MLNNHDYQFKIVLVGDSAVGKTSLLNRFCDDEFQETYQSTLGVDFKFKSVKQSKGNAKVQIWDTAGGQRFQSISSAYYRNAHAIIIVYDLTNENTFQSAKDFWYIQTLKNAQNATVVYLFGNKSDSSRQFNQQNVEKWVKKVNMKHFHVSAKSGSNVSLGFHEISKDLTSQAPKKKDLKKTIEIGFKRERFSKKKKRCC